MKLWTMWHVYTLLPTLAIFAILAVLIGRWLKNKDEKIRMIPIQVISVVLVVLEVAKQIYGVCIGYDLYWIPLHYCSLFVYLLPIFAFYRGKGKERMRSVAVVCCAALMLFLLVYPELIYGEWNIINFGKDFLSAHTVIFHNLVPFAFFLILALKLYTPQTKKDVVASTIFFVGYSVIAGTMANVLKTNYNNFYDCSIGPIGIVQDQIVASIGWWGQLIYVIGAGIATIVFSLISYFLFRGICALYYLIKKKMGKGADTVPNSESVKE
ncbi:MAG: YwaF family protein [Clostridia bacterium]|nr:YwaF family protein [Clostridia bacterium]